MSTLLTGFSELASIYPGAPAECKIRYRKRVEKRKEVENAWGTVDERSGEVVIINISRLCCSARCAIIIQVHVFYPFVLS